MKNLTKISLAAFAVVFILSLFGLTAFAADRPVEEKLTDANGILTVSHRGDTASFPQNSLEAVKSAEKIGADLISVSVGETADGVLVLCDTSVPLSQVCKTDKTSINELDFSALSGLSLYGIDKTVSDYKIPTLEDAVNTVDNSLLILDNAWSFRDDIYALLKKLGKENRILLRTDASSKEIAEWTKANPGLFVIGVYKANIVFNAISHFERLQENGQPLVQYQSKNYFNVSFGSFVTNRFSASGKTRAIAAMYSPDLCGQRADSCVGWDEMIERGYSAIETNCIASLVNYIKASQEARDGLSSLYQKAKSTDTALLSSVSAKNLQTALTKADTVLQDGKSSLGETESAFSLLNESMKNLAFHASGDIQKGGLNITAGKIVAAILVGSVLLAGEIYVLKMHKPRRKKEKGKTH